MHDFQRTSSKFAIPRVVPPSDLSRTPAGPFPFYDHEWSFLWGFARSRTFACRPPDTRSPPVQTQERPRREDHHQDDETKRDKQQSLPITFVADSLLLEESRRICCAHEDQFREVFHWVAGIKVTDTPPVYVLGHILQVEFSQQSAAGVSVDNASNILAFQTAEKAALPVVAHFHSHPGLGPTANTPSSIDLAFQERLERGGAIAIGGIYTRDGFLRFFAGKTRKFQLMIRGNNIVRCEPNLYRLRPGS